MKTSRKKADRQLSPKEIDRRMKLLVDLLCDAIRACPKEHLSPILREIVDGVDSKTKS